MNMKIPFFTLLLATFVLNGCGDGARSDSGSAAAALAQTIAKGDDHVTAVELADWLIKDRRDFDLVDIREEEDFSAGHIEGARHIPLAHLLSEASLASLPAARKVVVYSNGSAHAAQAALLLHLTGRNALALLGGFNYWQAYMHDPEKAGIAEMDPVQRAHYKAVSCHFAGEYVADAGLLQKQGAPASVPGAEEAEEADPLGLGLGLGTEQVQAMDLRDASTDPESAVADPLGLGLGLGLGDDAARDLSEPEPGETQKLLIKAEC
jgi:rhodanese-related sulfurtransferase